MRHSLAHTLYRVLGSGRNRLFSHRLAEGSDAEHERHELIAEKEEHGGRNGGAEGDAVDGRWVQA